MSKTKAYAWAGVDVDGANETKDRIKKIVRGTFGPEVLTEIGGFGGLFQPDWGQHKDPVLVASTDGVGTKLKIAFMTGIHNTVGADLVSHCANDILVQGARPLFFLDYLAMGKHDGDVVAQVVQGVADGCKASGCALLGGEMAEMPDFYAPGEYDLAGTIVGMVDKTSIVDGSQAEPGDVLIGLPARGLHTNGYSLARKLLFETAGYRIDSHIDELGGTVGETLLAPHKSYVDAVTTASKVTNIRGMAHITGGGMIDNIPRSLPENQGAVVHRGSWPELPVFDLLASIGEDIETDELFQDFNMGVGYVLIVSEQNADATVSKLKESGESAYIIGETVLEPSERVEIRTAS
jgi:phosphoribosylformylglycinamidine cyclo-ligase